MRFFQHQQKLTSFTGSNKAEYFEIQQVLNITFQLIVKQSAIKPDDTVYIRILVVCSRLSNLPRLGALTPLRVHLLKVLRPVR